MEIKLHIIFYSMYGYIHKLAEAIVAGTHEVSGVTTEIFRVPELVPEPILEKSGAKAAQTAFAHIPVLTGTEITEADAYIFGTPCRSGNLCSQMRSFLNQLSCAKQPSIFVGKVASVFTSIDGLKADQTNTLTSFHSALLDLGMIVTGVPYVAERHLLMQAASGDITYSTHAHPHQPSEQALAIAHYQGQHVAKMAKQLKTIK